MPDRTFPGRRPTMLAHSSSIWTKRTRISRMIKGLSVNEQSPVLTREAIAIAQAQPTAQPQPAPEVAKNLKQEAALPIKASQPLMPVTDVSAAPVAASNSQQASIDGFVQRARQQMLDGNTAVGPGHYRGRTQEVRWRNAAEKSQDPPMIRVEEEVERINLAPSLNVQDHQEWLSEIHTLSGDDYPQIEDAGAHIGRRHLPIRKRERTDRASW